MCEDGRPGGRIREVRQVHYPLKRKLTRHLFLCREATPLSITMMTGRLRTRSVSSTTKNLEGCASAWSGPKEAQITIQGLLENGRSRKKIETAQEKNATTVTKLVTSLGIAEVAEDHHDAPDPVHHGAATRPAEEILEKETDIMIVDVRLADLQLVDPAHQLGGLGRQ